MSMRYTPKTPRETVGYTIFMDKKIHYYNNTDFAK